MVRLCAPRLGHDSDGLPDRRHGAPKLLGALQDASGAPLVIDGLWALAVSPSGTVFFTSGSDGETHGTFGTLTP